MAMKRLSMSQIRQVLRLRLEHGLSSRATARACSVGLATVTEYLARARRAGLSWPLPEEMETARWKPSSTQRRGKRCVQSPSLTSR